MDGSHTLWKNVYRSNYVPQPFPDSAPEHPPNPPPQPATEPYHLPHAQLQPGLIPAEIGPLPSLQHGHIQSNPIQEFDDAQSPYSSHSHESSPQFDVPKAEPKTKRSVSDSKRAAQNRSAQKAFRKRRDKYVKDLEATAARVPGLEKTIKDLRSENVQLRNYIMALQSRYPEPAPGPHYGGPL